MHSVLPGHGLEGGQLLQRRLPQTLVPGDVVRRARGLAVVPQVGSVDRDHLALEASLGPGPGGALLRQQPEGVGVAPGDAPLLGDALCPLELGRELVTTEVGPGDGPTGPGLGVGAERYPAHRLDPTGDDGVHRARGDEPGGQVGRLLRRPTLRVDRGGGHGEGQAGGEPRRAGDVEGLLAHGGHAPAHDLVDLGGIDARPIEHGPLDGAEQVGGMHAGQAPAPAPDGAACGFDDHDVSHGRSLWDP